MLKLAPESTFVATVRIHVPGGEAVPVNFRFRHKGKAALKEFIDRAAGLDDVTVLDEIVAGWEGVDTEYCRPALADLLDAYPTSAVAILEGYYTEIGKAAAKN